MALVETLKDRVRMQLGHKKAAKLRVRLSNEIRVQLSSIVAHVIASVDDTRHLEGAWITFVKSGMHDDLEAVMPRSPGFDVLAMMERPQQLAVKFVNVIRTDEDPLKVLFCVEMLFSWLSVVYFLPADLSGREPPENLEHRREYHGLARGQVIRGIQELNQSFERNGIPFRFTRGQLIPVASTYAYNEFVEPALVLLGDPRYKAALDEFLAAHVHFRETRYEDSATHAGVAAETFTKLLTGREGWKVETDRGKPPTARNFILASMKALQLPGWFEEKLLTASTIRNKIIHKEWAPPVFLQRALAGYAIHSAAALMLFLSEAADAKRES